MPVMHKTIIFTDLDGTLLDADNYGYDAALPALAEIAARNIPLVFCSSKTRAEIEVYRERLGNRHPFIVENGGGIFIPHGYFSAAVAGDAIDGYQRITLGTPYAEMRRRFVALREQLHVAVRGFSDMSTAEVAKLTGLPPDAAARAMQRDFEEPFVFTGTPDEHFLHAIEDSGLNWTQGRIFHIMGQHDKGRAVSILQSLYAAELGAITSIALGDNLNDLPMLNAVDYPVLVMHKDGGFDQRVALPGLLRTTSAGPHGWNDILLQLLCSGSEKPCRHQEAVAHNE
jgi:mannosyl-3-phosphoglycerate phosphatase family protein